MNKKKLYTRWCKKCKKHYETKFKYGKICKDCDGRVWKMYREINKGKES